MSNTASSRADPVVVFPLGRWCPPQETSQPPPPPKCYTSRDHSWYGLSQWEEALLCNASLLLCNASTHWPSPYPKWAPRKLWLTWINFYLRVQSWAVQPKLSLADPFLIWFEIMNRKWTQMKHILGTCTKHFENGDLDAYGTHCDHDYKRYHSYFCVHQQKPAYFADGTALSRALILVLLGPRL